MFAIENDMRGGSLTAGRIGLGVGVLTGALDLGLAF